MSALQQEKCIVGGFGRQLSMPIDREGELVSISQLYVAIKGNRRSLPNGTKSAPIAQRREGQSVAKTLCCGVAVSTEGRNYGGSANVVACFFAMFSHCQENDHI